MKQSKSAVLPTRARINQFFGVTSESLISYREARMDIGDKQHVLVIVPDDFPIEEDGLLAMPFLDAEEDIIDTKKRTVELTKTMHRILNVNSKPSRATVLTENSRLSHMVDISEREILWEVIKEFEDIFTLPDDDLPCTTLVKHSIPVTDSVPVYVKQFRYPLGHLDVITEQVKDTKGKGIVSDSTSPHNSSLLVVPKKADASRRKKWRVVVNFRGLNNKTLHDAYPLPNIEEILDQLGRARWFSAFDLASGFHQIEMKEDKQKMAFSTPAGHFEYNRIPLGLKNAPATFQRMLDQALTGLIGKVCFVYLDDIVVFAENLDKHRDKLRILFQRLREVGLKLQPDKCEYLKPELQYLGHLITKAGVKPNPETLRSVKEFPVPEDKKNIKQFLGLAGYNRRFIKGFSKIDIPMNNLFKKKARFKWGTSQQQAFEKLKNELLSDNVLAYPNFSMEFILATDVSGEALGAILIQKDENGQERPISFASRTINTAEQNSRFDVWLPFFV